MIERRIVRRYATALFNAASKAGLVDHIESDLGLISYTFENSPELIESIASPLIPGKVKRQVVASIFEGKVHQLTLDYMYLLIEKHREEAIPATEEEFVLLANDARGIISVDVTTAIELDAQRQKALIAKLSELTGKSVSMNLTIDPDIKGGVMVKIGDRLIDGSIRGQLAALRDRLLS